MASENERPEYSPGECLAWGSHGVIGWKVYKRETQQGGSYNVLEIRKIYEWPKGSGQKKSTGYLPTNKLAEVVNCLEEVDRKFNGGEAFSRFKGSAPTQTKFEDDDIPF